MLRENLNAPNTDVISSWPTNSTDADSSSFQNSDNFKPGLRLPKKPEDWLVANAFFHSLFSSYDGLLISGNLDYFVQDIQEKIYNYFKSTFGTTEAIASIYNDKYCDLPVKSLKATLKKLKGNCPSNIEEIRFVSKLIRSKLNKNKIIEADLEEKLSTKFWSTCQDTFNKATNCIPTFPVTVCQTYFVKILSITGRLSFSIPDWIPKLNPPNFQYDDSPPTYKEVTSCVKKARSSASASPIDQLSILILKKCPMARTILHKILVECWTQKKIPKCWKNSATILIFKKGDTSDPGNFRPISLQAVWYKILASLMKRRLFKFLSQNNYLDMKKQKGFWPGIDGVSEHTEILTHLIKDAKIHSRSLIITLLDLKNAFGEVHHELIKSALRYHHVPNSFIDLFDNIYNDATISISVGKEQTGKMKILKRSFTR